MPYSAHNPNLVVDLKAIPVGTKVAVVSIPSAAQAAGPGPRAPRRRRTRGPRGGHALRTAVSITLCGAENPCP